MSEVNCHNCRGACCRAGTGIRLTEDELDFMRASGASLEEISPPGLDPIVEQLRASSPNIIVLDSDERGLYGLEEDCPFLEDNGEGPALCSIYGDERRPAICGEFTMGGAACRDVRVLRGVDPPPPQMEL